MNKKGGPNGSPFFLCLLPIVFLLQMATIIAIGQGFLHGEHGYEDEPAYPCCTRIA